MSRIVSGIWGPTPPATARAQVHTHVAGLRGLLDTAGVGRDLLRTVPAGYLLRPPPGSVDLDDFEEQVGSARRLLDDGRPDAAVTTLRSALRLWRGSGLDGLRAAFATEAAEQLDHRRLAAFELLADAYHAAHRDAELIPELYELSTDHPLHEGLRHRLMLALHRNGRTADALRVYREGWNVTTRELGIEPGARLRELEAAILQGEQPVRRAPAAQAAPSAGFQLPPDAPAFVGRARERDRVLSWLGTPDEGPAAVVVSGPPGVGKTTFAVHVGRAVREQYPDGQLFLPMHGSSGTPMPAAEAAATLLRGLGFAGAAIPDKETERLALYRTALAERRVLIVLDDVAGAADVRGLLPGAPGCALLVTSRSTLAGIDADRVRLGPLSAEEALALLASMAGDDRIADDPASAARLVRRCGYLPLAVRIAGARLTGNSQRRLAELNAALRDQRRRLDELTVEDLAVRTVLASADRRLSAPAREAFHLLSSSLPAHDVAGWTVAAVLDVPPSRGSGSWTSWPTRTCCSRRATAATGCTTWSASTAGSGPCSTCRPSGARPPRDGSAARTWTWRSVPSGSSAAGSWAPRRSRRPPGACPSRWPAGWWPTRWRGSRRNASCSAPSCAGRCVTARSAPPRAWPPRSRSSTSPAPTSTTGGPRTNPCWRPPGEPATTRPRW
ncbi:BTAD domain-containing putative transcriptional regulator [Nonomuraea antimicrobica]